MNQSWPWRSLIIFLWYSQLAANYFLIKASATDPGIVPARKDWKAIDLHPKYVDQDAYFYRNDGTFQPLFYYQVQKYNTAQLFKFKFCPTCKIWRPPRSFHCWKDEICVLRFDHHCWWIGTCLGLRNYSYFFWFISHLTVMILVAVVLGMANLMLHF